MKRVFGMNSIDSQLRFKKEHPDKFKTRMALYEVSSGLLKQARDECFKYVETGIVTDNMLKAAFNINEINGYLKSGSADYMPVKPDSNDMEDLRQIWNGTYSPPLFF